MHLDICRFGSLLWMSQPTRADAAAAALTKNSKNNA